MREAIRAAVGILAGRRAVGRAQEDRYFVVVSVGGDERVVGFGGPIFSDF